MLKSLQLSSRRSEDWDHLPGGPTEFKWLVGISIFILKYFVINGKYSVSFGKFSIDCRDQPPAVRISYPAY